MSSGARVLLVVTGNLEQVALGVALGQLFPSATFKTTKTNGFTSQKLPMPVPGRHASKAEDLVEELLGAAISPERGVPPYDYAVAVEDVELFNEVDVAALGAGQADEGIECILAHMKLAVSTILDRKNDEQTTTVLAKGKARQAPSIATDGDRRRFLRERCSFHLLRPMAEALLFGDRAALDRAAGDPTKLSTVHFDPMRRDIEAFETNDPAYLATPDGEGCWAKSNRRRHPKHYLEYLLDPAGTAIRPYKEVEHGKRALSQLDWQAVLAPSTHARMVRAFLEDLADMLGVALPPWAAGACHPAMERRSGGALRNLP
jgi:hypothetical protein